MPLSKAHKKRTRQQIVEAAARTFRRDGYNGAGIDKIMAEAGLTRGGFYAHFPSKAALFAEVLATQHGLIGLLSARSDKDNQALRGNASAILWDYLAPEHLSEVGSDCTFANLTADAPRGGKASKRALTGAVRQLIEELGRGHRTSAKNRARAIRAAVMSIGAVTLAHATGDNELSAELLSVCREAVRDDLS